MKFILLIAGVLTAAWTLATGWRLQENSAGLVREEKVLTEKISRTRDEIRRLETLSRNMPVPLARAVGATLRDAGVLGGALGLKITVSPFKAGGSEWNKAAQDSLIHGLKQLTVEIVYSGIHDRAGLGALLDGLLQVQRAHACVLKRVYHEADRVVCQIEITGIDTGGRS